MKTIEADDFRTVITPGTYVAKTDATVFLSRGKGDARQDINWVDYKAGQSIQVPSTVNGHWYGLEPNGDIVTGHTSAIIESV
jgi:hypothetical protein